MQVELWPIERVKEYDRNPRNNDAAIGPVAESIRQFGFKVPLLVDRDGILIAGHTRIRAAKQLGLAEVPVIQADDLTPEQVRAFRIADNQLATIADWNLELLPIELSELQAVNVDLKVLGFSDNDLAKLLDTTAKDGLTDPDEVPEPPDEAITKPGDLWILGNHRLLCGDSANPEHVDRLLDGNTIQLVNTDPPYNVRVEPRSKAAIAAGNSSFATFGQQATNALQHPENTEPVVRKLRPRDRPLENDFVSDEEFERLLHGWFGNIARVLDRGRAFYIWGGYANLASYPPALAATGRPVASGHSSGGSPDGLYLSGVVVWNKLHPVLTRKDFMGAFELAFYGWRKGAAHQFFGPNNATDLWEIKKVSPQKMIHLTEKPVELAVRAMQYSSLPGENVLDLFGGSGSTLIAAEQTNRKAFLMELDPLYCDVIVQRFEAFSGRKAERYAMAA